MRVKLSVELESGKNAEETHNLLRDLLIEFQHKLNNSGFNAHTRTYKVIPEKE